MPVMVHNDASKIMLEQMKQSREQVIQEIRDGLERAQNKNTPAWLRDDYQPTDADFHDYFDALTTYVGLVEERAFDIDVSGVKGTAFTLVEYIEDPLTAPAGGNAFAQGRILLAMEHPETKVIGIFKLDHHSKTHYSRDKVLFNVSLSDEELTALIRDELEKNVQFEVFKQSGVTSSLLPIQVDYKLRKKWDDWYKVNQNRMGVDIKLSDHAVQHFLNSLSLQPYSSRDSSAVTFSNPVVYTHFSQYVQHREMVRENINIMRNSLRFDANALCGKSSKNFLAFLSQNVNADDVYTKIYQLSDSRSIWRTVINQTIEERRNALIDEASIGVDLTRGQDYSLYPDEVLNFILSGKDQQVRANRKEFMDNFYVKMFGDIDKASQLFMDSIESLNIAINDARAVLTSCRDKEYKSALSLVDERVFPKDAICWTLGLPAMSNKEFDYGMRLAGLDSVINVSTGTSNNAIRKSAFFMGIVDHPSSRLTEVSLSTLGTALSLAKIDKQWLKSEKDSKLPYMFENNRRMFDYSLVPDHEERNELINRLSAVQNAFMPFLVNAGRMISKAQSAGDSDKIKEIGHKMAWLSKREESIPEALLKLEKKHKIMATYKDYPDLLEQFMESYVLRVLSTCSLDDKDAFFSLDNSANLSIDESEVSTRFYRHYDDNNDAEYDEEEDEWISPEPAEEIFEAFSAPSALEIKKWVISDRYNFKEILDLNDSLHKEYGKILRQLNNFSDKNFEWEPMLSAPFVYQESDVVEPYTAYPIHSRIDLLEEGNMMGHCVFSYLSKSMAGESYIFSIRDKDDNRVATLELVRDGEHDEDEKPLFSLSQCFGPRNTSAPYGAHALAEQLIEQLNEREIDFKHEPGLSDESKYLFEEAESDLANKGDMFRSIPHNSDAAYLIEEIVDKFLPEGLSFKDYFESSRVGCYTEVVRMSDFYQEMTQLNKMKATYGVSVADLVALKNDLRLGSIENIEKLINKIIPLQQHIASFIENTERSGLTLEQQFNELKKSPDFLSMLGQTIPAGVQRGYSSYGYSALLNEESLKPLLRKDVTVKDLIEGYPVRLEQLPALDKTVLDLNPKNTPTSPNQSIRRTA